MSRTPVYLLLASLLVGCGTSLVGVGFDVLDMEVSLSADAWSPGDTVDITVTVSNPTKRDINYSNSACPLTVELVTAMGQPARLTGDACIAILQPHILGPDESDETTFAFHGSAWQATSASASAEWVELAAGTYYVIASINGRSAESPPVALEVLR